MSIDDLLHVEHDLRNQNGQVDKHIASLHGRLQKLVQKQNSLEKLEHKVGAALDFEVRQRKQRERDLDRAKAEVEAKKSQVVRMTEEAEKLRVQIRDISETVLSLNREKHYLEDQYAHPSLQEAFLNDAERIGPVTQHVANKTVEMIFPELRVGLQEAAVAKQALQHGPAVTTLFASLVVYLLAVGLVWVCYRCTRNLCRMLTMVRMLFSVDLAFAVLWMLICVGYLLVLEDPLQRLARTHGGISLLVQLVLMTAVVGNVLLRITFLSTGLTAHALCELFFVTLVAQHYYQNVWVPVLFDQGALAGFFGYVVYVSVNGGLAIYRARAMGRPVEKLRMEFEDVDHIMRGSEWVKERVGRVFRSCEEWLTKGTLENGEDDEESIRTSSIAELRTKLCDYEQSPFYKRR